MRDITKLLLYIVLGTGNKIKKSVFLAIIFQREIDGHLNTFFALANLYTFDLSLHICQLLLNSFVEMTALLLELHLYFLTLAMLFE